MSDILIKNMEMPKSCFGCPFDNIKYTIEKKCNTNDWHECFVSKRDCTLIAKRGEKAKWCPLIPVPEHGDLIGRDELVKSLSMAYHAEDALEFSNKSVWAVLESAEVVLEAST